MFHVGYLEPHLSILEPGEYQATEVLLAVVNILY